MSHAVMLQTLLERHHISYPLLPELSGLKQFVSQYNTTILYNNTWLILKKDILLTKRLVLRVPCQEYVQLLWYNPHDTTNSVTKIPEVGLRLPEWRVTLPLFSSVQCRMVSMRSEKLICAPSTTSLRSFPSVAFEAVPMFV